jgi:DNA replication protein DnaC
LPTKRLASAKFETFDLVPGMEKAVAAVHAVVAGTQWCALLVGSPGNGKTHLAIAAMHEFGLTRSMYWKVPSFLAWIREKAYGDKEGANMSVETLIASYVTGDFLLVLDDFGVEKMTDWAAEQLYRIIDSRYEDDLPTIVTTNRELQTLDARIVSRLGAGVTLCSGADRRRA